ncbi:GDP-mannose 4,6-dehydratase [Glycomyces albidus]|uniref:GDP-mannose 4,6-dehydratase n=1 Tax=Glycomyces albidus TaxID=2656774 RepID=A0A6L5G559_9ACTN|nr:GDP-mannose 4,6-dehydratase [Glycomyces albidus]MQM24783.1 GDP-mannose 4,6-dehydratase [Glycomyces albidus]
MKTALITGITGQDGSYLAELLLAKGYVVHGVVRHASSLIANTSRLDGVYQDPHESGRRLFLHKGDVTDAGLLVNLIRDIEPDEIYNLAAQSHVRVSFDLPDYTANVTALGAIRLLEAVRASRIDAKVYQASTSEMFGTTAPPQNETAQFHPRSPYGVAKLYAHWATVNYRESYGMFAVNGIAFNHESPRRGETFVTRKITRAVARIEAGLEKKVYLGNLDAVRDWGYAPEYVEAMWLMLQHREPVDYVIATGRAATVRDFAEAAFAHAGLDWREHIEHDDRYERPAEVPELVGDPTKIEREIGWKARVHWDELARIMVDADRKALHGDSLRRSAPAAGVGPRR